MFIFAVTPTSHTHIHTSQAGCGGATVMDARTTRRGILVLVVDEVVVVVVVVVYEGR